MNILLVSLDYPPLLGGIANVSYNYAKNLTAQQDRIIVIASRVKNYKNFDKQNQFATYRVSNIKILREVELFFSMLYLLKKYKIQVVQNLAWYPEGAISYLVNMLTGIPFVIHVHAMDFFENKKGFFNKLKYNFFRSLLKKAVFSRSKKIIAGSRYIKDALLTRGIDWLKIRTIPYGVDSRIFKPDMDTKEIKTKYCLRDKKVLLTVGRLVDYKGHDMVIKTIPRLILTFPNLVYWIVGTGPYEAELKKLVDDLNLKQNVIFVGALESNELPFYYNACDAFIMMSREIYSEAKIEGFGLVFLEASACRKPIVAGRSGGIGDAVIDKLTGILVNPLDLNEIESAVAKILSDEQYANLLGDNGRERIKKEGLDWTDISQRVRATLSGAIEK